MANHEWPLYLPNLTVHTLHECAGYTKLATLFYIIMRRCALVFLFNFYLDKMNTEFWGSGQHPSRKIVLAVKSFMTTTRAWHTSQQRRGLRIIAFTMPQVIAISWLHNATQVIITAKPVWEFERNRVKESTEWSESRSLCIPVGVVNHTAALSVPSKCDNTNKNVTSCQDRTTWLIG